MKPASTSGTRHEMPRPAGVKAPDKDRPTVVCSSRYLDVNSRQASRSRPALYDKNASSTSCGSVVSPVSAGGSMRLWLILCRYFCWFVCFFMERSYDCTHRCQPAGTGNLELVEIRIMIQ